MWPENLLVSESWATAGYVKENRETVRRLQTALSEAVVWLNDPKNFTERFKIVARWTKLKPELVADLAPSLQCYRSYPKGFTDWDVLKPQVKLFLKYGLIRKDIDVTKFDPWR